MENISLELSKSSRIYEPGEIMSGNVRWSVAETPRKAVLILNWFTKGEGDRDWEIVEGVDFEPQSAMESQPFQFRLPLLPYSFTGKLVALVWSLELQVDQESAAEEFVLSPFGEAIDLQQFYQPYQ